MSVQPLQRWTPADYLAFERTHPGKHEFVDGQVVLLPPIDPSEPIN
jgi:hypothetical protein